MAKKAYVWDGSAWIDLASSLTPGTVGPAGDPTLLVTAPKTSAYTIADGDQSSLTQLDGSFVVSIPTDETFYFAIGAQIHLLQVGPGLIQIAAVTPGTTTINATPGLKLRTQWSSATLIKRAADTWVAIGDLMA